MTQESELHALANLIAAQIKGAPPRPKLRLVGRDELKRAPEDMVMRASRLDRIRWLRRSYGLDFIVKQHTYGLAGIDCLESAGLQALQVDLEKGRECVVEGIPFDDAQLVWNQAEPEDGQE